MCAVIFPNFSQHPIHLIFHM